MAKKGKKGKKENKREKRSKLPKRRRERQTSYDIAVSTLGRIVCIYAVLTFLGILAAVVLGVIAAV